MVGSHICLRLGSLPIASAGCDELDGKSLESSCSEFKNCLVFTVRHVRAVLNEPSCLNTLAAFF